MGITTPAEASGPTAGASSRQAREAQALSVIKELMEEGRRLLEAGSCELALDKFGEVLVLNPFHVPAIEGRAEAHARLGQDEEAAYYLRRAAFLRDEWEL